MKKETDNDYLKSEIKLLKTAQSNELTLLKQQYHIAYESLKPINLLLNTVKEASTSTSLKNGIGDSMIGITTGFLTRKIVFGSLGNPLTKVLGTLFQFAITNMVANNTDLLKSKAKNLLSNVLKHRSRSKLQNHENEHNLFI